jgi:hypothetical protein
MSETHLVEDLGTILCILVFVIPFKKDGRHRYPSPKVWWILTTTSQYINSLFINSIEIDFYYLYFTNLVIQMYYERYIPLNKSVSDW